MTLTPGKDTIYDDWLRRRTELAQRPEEDHEHQLQLFDYLLQRYQGSEAAHQPSRAPWLDSLSVNERAIVVHHHTDGYGGGPSNVANAQERISGILSRMQSRSSETDYLGGGFEEGPSYQVSAKTARLWNKIGRSIRWGSRPDRLMKRALDECPLLPVVALEHLFARIDVFFTCDERAFELLTRCQSRGVFDLLARAWRRRAVNRCCDKTALRIREYFCDEENREQKRQRMRRELADERDLVRLEALSILAEIGSLEDIALLSDLADLHGAAGEERRAILHAMQILSHGPFGVR